MAEQAKAGYVYVYVYVVWGGPKGVGGPDGPRGDGIAEVLAGKPLSSHTRL